MDPGIYSVHKILNKLPSRFCDSCASKVDKALHFTVGGNEAGLQSDVSCSRPQDLAELPVLEMTISHVGDDHATNAGVCCAWLRPYGSSKLVMVHAAHL